MEQRFFRESASNPGLAGGSTVRRWAGERVLWFANSSIMSSSHSFFLFHFVFLLLHAGDWSRFFRSARAAKNGKPGPPARRGSHVDAVPKNSDGLTHDEETYAETVVSSRIEPGGRLKENGICSPGMPIPVS